MMYSFILATIGSPIKYTNNINKDGKQLNFICDINGFKNDAVLQFIQTNKNNMQKYYPESSFIDAANKIYKDFGYDGYDVYSVSIIGVDCASIAINY